MVIVGAEQTIQNLNNIISRKNDEIEKLKKENEKIK